ncbi:MAG: single-stranded DNA-binding protein [Candidatus Peregrinibacteria bacterium]|nr:single-stranded DNA-binding protein [Candidatus Peregrinibacteria bacterium]MDZ4244509.1 single-stranded DNA-binding protein [Candidatus Gracilibacteria bacterium]
MYSLNRAQLIGNITRDPETRQLSTGVTVCSFSVATNQVWNDQNGVRQEKAEFHDIVAWRKLAEIAGQYLTKGSKVYIEGRIQTREWDAEDGTKRRKTEIVAENLIMLDKKGNAVDMDRTAAGIGAAKVAAVPADMGDPLEDKSPVAVSAADSNIDGDVAIDDLPF